jgi:hypothetical protein
MKTSTKYSAIVISPVTSSTSETTINKSLVERCTYSLFVIYLSVLLFPTQELLNQLDPIATSNLNRSSRYSERRRANTLGTRYIDYLVYRLRILSLFKSSIGYRETRCGNTAQYTKQTSKGTSYYRRDNRCP